MSEPFHSGCQGVRMVSMVTVVVAPAVAITTPRVTRYPAIAHAHLAGPALHAIQVVRY